MNLVQAAVDDGLARFGGHALALSGGVDLGGRRNVVLGIRPTDFRRSHEPRPERSLTAVVEVTELLGAEMRVLFRVAAQAGGELAAAAGTSDGSAAGAGPGGMTFTACIEPDERVVPGSRVSLDVDLDAVHFFDSETGMAIEARRGAPGLPVPAMPSAAGAPGRHSGSDD